MSTENLAGHVDGLHDLAERLEQTGIPTRTVTVNIHPESWADIERGAGERLADALGLTTRIDYPTSDAGPFTTWEGGYDGVLVAVFGATPKRPDTCCGKCPPIKGGGYDCTCEGNPRCTDQEDQA